MKKATRQLKSDAFPGNPWLALRPSLAPAAASASAHDPLAAVHKSLASLWPALAKLGYGPPNLN